MDETRTPPTEARVRADEQPDAQELERAAARSALQRQTLDALASDPDRAMAQIRARVEVLAHLRAASLAMTGGTDWTLNRDKSGRATAMLRSSGALKIRKLWGISIRDVEVEIVRERVGAEERLFAEARGDAESHVTHEEEPGLVGRRGADEEFVGRDQDRVGLGDLKQAARTSLETKAVRVLCGLTAVDPAELAGAWKCTVAEVTARCYLGHGFGSSRERQAAASPTSGPLTWDYEGKQLWAAASKRGEAVGLKGEAVARAVLEAAGVELGQTIKETITRVPREKFAAILRAAETYDPPGAPSAGGDAQ